ncbi:MAG: protoporphyrinogen oxidase [Deltaproteobacteria bacterium]|nr:protoporphyrinogen oxidase [Deltaproteobacteria bacterium]
MKQTVIIGGGVSGLSIGFALLEKGKTPDEVVVLEKSNVAGGNVRTDSIDGYTIEQGPNGFLDNSPPTLQLVDKLGIDYILQSNANAARRFIWRDEKLREIKPNPLAFMTSGVLPLFGALRVALEPFQKKAGSDSESVFDFAARRIGKSAAKNLVGAMVQGVFAGDAHKIELKSAFPKMYAMEQQYGSLVKAMFAKKRARKQHGGPAGPSGKLTSFDDGMQTLPGALAGRLGDMVQLNREAVSVVKKDDRFIVTLADGEVMETQTVVCAQPAWSAANQLAGLSPSLSQELAAIHYPSVLVVATGFSADDLPRVPNGFGYLVPRGEGVRSLGCLWTSSVWKYRAPEGKVLLRSMVGGSVDPDARDLSDDEAIACVLSDLKNTMHISALPELTKVYRHPRAIAQYECGHGARVKRIESEFLKFPGLFLSGSSYGGISVNHCVDEAPRVAEAVTAFLDR